MKYTPHEYQKEGIQALIQLGGTALLLSPGMGKTSMAQGAFTIIQGAYTEPLKMLVIAPINPMYTTWPEETRKWDDFNHLKISIIHGSPAKRERALKEDADIYIINPEGVKWLFQQNTMKDIGHPDWSILCVDESTKFKNSDSKRFKAIKKHLQVFPRRWIMTGTFAPNGLEDLFGQVYILDRGSSLGKFITHYRNAYFYQIGFGGYQYEPRAGAIEAIPAKIAEHNRVVQLKARDYLDMPDLVKIVREVDLPEKATKVYKAIEKDFISELLGSTVVAVNQAVSGQKCRQIACGNVYDEDGDAIHVHDAKLEALQDIIEETNGHPLLIMYEFVSDREAIKKKLGKDCICVTGMKGFELKDTLDMFREGEIKYLLMHPSTTHGINVQKSCNHIVWYSIIWDLEQYIQANTRLERQGQTAPSVMCYLLAARDTIDFKVAKALAEKDVTQATIEANLRKYCESTEEYQANISY